MKKISRVFFENLQQKLTLGARLYILFVTLLVVSVVGVGLSSYLKAKETTMDAIETRLIRETELMGYIAENLKFVYVSDEEYFRQQLAANVRTQQEILHKDGIEVDMMYIENGEAYPFSVSEEKLPPMPEHVVENISTMRNGLVHEKIDNEAYTITFREMPQLNGVYVLLIPTRSYMEPVQQMVYFMIVGIIISVFVATIIVTFLIRAVTKPLNQLRNTMREVRAGEFQAAEPIRTSVPEITSLHKSYNAMIAHVSELLHELKATTKELEHTGGELLSSSERTLDSSHHLVSAITTVRTGAEETATSSDENARGFGEMKQVMDMMRWKMNQVFDSSEKMSQSAKSGEGNIKELISTTYQFEKDFENLLKKINDVKQFSSSITSLVGLVNGISEQTKLLALNASIEAVRAGDAGKGFAVVAQEVKKLAEQSTKVTEDISKAISKMEAIATGATNEFEMMHGRIKDNLSLAGKSRESLDVLMEEIQEEGHQLKEIQTELKRLGTILPELEQATLHFASISQETLASSEEMLAVSDEQIKQVEGTNKVGEKLRHLSQSLANMTERFTLIEDEKKC